MILGAMRSGNCNPAQNLLCMWERGFWATLRYVEHSLEYTGGALLVPTGGKVTSLLS